MVRLLKTSDRIVLSKAIGYLESHAREIFERRNPWWKFWSNDDRKIHALEIAMALKELRDKHE